MLPIHWSLAAVALAGVLAGLAGRQPAEVSFILSAETRQLQFDWPCDASQRWAFGEATLERPDMLDEPPVPLRNITLTLERAEVALVQTGDRELAVEIGPSRLVEGAAEAGQGVLRHDGGELALGERIRLRIAIPAGEHSVAARGLFRIGGSVSAHGTQSRLLAEGRIVGRDLPLFGSERRSFLDERVEQGGIMLSHPKTERLQRTEPAWKAARWQPWCEPAPDEHPDHAIAAIRVQPDKPMSVSLYRRADAVGVQTLGAVVGGDSPITLFFVPRWTRWISSALVQTAIVVIAAGLTLLSTIHGGLQAGRRPSGEEG
ncbi:MAG: hypothetical protein SNJ79_06710 [Sphingomonadaceae bacterium]